MHPLQHTQYLWTALLLIAGSCISAPALGQETLPPPRETPRQRPPRERTERPLLNLLGTVLEQPQPAGGTRGLDVGRLNEGFPALLAPIVANEKWLESANMALDPRETDLADNLLTGTTTAVLDRTGWTDKKSHLQVDARSRIESPGDRPSRGVIDGEIVLRTDLLPLVNYALPIVRDELRTSVAEAARDAKADAPADPDLVFRSRLADKLDRAGPIRSLDELADLITYGLSLRFMATSEAIEQLQAEVDTATDERTAREAARRLAQVRLERQDHLSGRAMVWRDATGAAERITLTSANTHGRNAFQIDQLEVTLVPDRLTVGGTLSINQGVDLFPLVRPLVIASLTGLQNRDPLTLELQRGFIRRELDKIRPWIVGNQQPRPAEVRPLGAEF